MAIFVILYIFLFLIQYDMVELDNLVAGEVTTIVSTNIATSPSDK